MLKRLVKTGASSAAQSLKKIVSIPTVPFEELGDKALNAISTSGSKLKGTVGFLV